MQARTAPRHWLVVLVSTLFAVLGCHMVFGNFEETPTALATGVCDKNAKRCKDEYLLSCNADQSAWVRSDVCASKDQCDEKAGCLVCPRADALRCNGSRLEYCSADRSSWQLKEQCDSVEMCGPTGCRPCDVPGQLQCTVSDGKTIIRECNASTKLWTVVTDCPNEAVCMATLTQAQADTVNWNRKCEPGCPQAGGFRCDGVNLQRCPESLVNWMSVAACGSTALCGVTLDRVSKDPNAAASIETCDPGCGTAGQPRCRDGNILERCSQDMTKWEVAMECPSGMQCTTQGQGDCVVCTTGDYQCNGTFLERCGDDHKWAQVSDCKSMALCQIQNDSATGKSMGSCITPSCPRAGDNVCGTDTDPKTAGATLWECKSDLTGYVKGLTCDTKELCNATSKICILPTCVAGARHCSTQNPLLVEECNQARNDWVAVTTCKSGEFCDPNDKAQPCKHECPAPLMCNDRTLQTCSAAGGVVDKAQCDTKELCACAVAGNCPAGTKTDGCGTPVCGSTLANFRCTDTAGTATSGQILQQCKSSRDGWTRVADCGATNLCYPGVSPTFASGYCAICPIAGEIACMGSATQVCSADRKTWSAQTSCAFGCVDNATTDYCAQCFASEKRCSGTQLLACSTDRKTLPVQTACAQGCIEGGTNDFCALCAVGETRCDSTLTRLQTCATGQGGLNDSGACANGCIDSGTADYCAECKAGESQCSGAGVRACNATTGKWGAVTACTMGTCVDSGVADYCPGCSPSELRCSGSTLLQCNTDQKGLTQVMTCANGCVDSGLVDYCAACQSGELRCSGTALQQCSTDRKSLATVQTCSYGCIDSGIADYCPVCNTGELRCSASTLQVCSTDRKSLSNSQSCTNGCFDSGNADYCGDCTPGATRCSTTTGLQTCGADGRWPTTVTACANGCFGTSPAAYCGDCKPGVDTQCSGSNLLSCTTAGRWSTTSTSCTRGCIDSGTSDFCAECSANDHSCSGSTLQNCVSGKYSGGSACSYGCFGSAPSAACGVCNAGDTNCSGTTLQVCVNGAWTTSMECGTSNGCITSGSTHFCGECAINGARCNTSSSRQVCTAGKWVADQTCPCVGTSCVDCNPGDTDCDGTTNYKTCSSAGSWGTSMSCPNMACLSKACVDCMPGAVRCSGTIQSRTCSATGTWNTAADCPNRACVNDTCVDCQPGSVICANGTQSRTCDADGHYLPAANCLSGACLNDNCTACAPGTSQCTSANTKVQTCSSAGVWGMESGCDYGCNDNGTADACQPCALGTSQCGTNVLQTCEVGGWMSGSCMNCFDSGDHDYCGECSPSAAPVCTSTTKYHACGTDGHWQTEVDCATNGEVCLNGACVACTPGTSRCEADGVNRRLCSQSGSWSDPQPCDPPATVCNVNTNACE
ncbi:MAG: hypothetical protein QM756_40150 [Polyangiaceae bacterium]